MSSQSSISEIRRVNLCALTDRFPSRKSFAQVVERDEAMLRRYRVGQPIGNDFARHLERMLDLPDGYMDHPHPAATPGGLLATMEAFVASEPPKNIADAIGALLEALTAHHQK